MTLFPEGRIVYYHFVIALGLMGTLLFFSSFAHAADVSPGDSCSGFAAGSYRASGGPEIPSGAFLVCDGSVWQPILRYSSSGNRVSIGSGELPAAPLDVQGEIRFSSSGLSCSSLTEGAVRYTGDDPPWEYCDGDDWVNFKQPRCQDDDTGECYLDAIRANDDPDFTAANIANGVNILGITGTFVAGGACAPDPFEFTDQVDVALSTYIVSNTQKITGISGSCTLLLSPETAGTVIVNASDTGKPWAIVQNDDDVQIRVLSSDQALTEVTAQYSVGDHVGEWSITTDQACPGAEDFTTPGTYSISVSEAQKNCTFSLVVKGAGGRSVSGMRSGGAGGGVTFDFVPGVPGTLHVLVGQAGRSSGTSIGGGGAAVDGGGGGGGASAAYFDDGSTVTLLAISGGGGGGADYWSGAHGGDGGSANNCGSAGGNGSNGGCNNVGGTATGTWRGGHGGSDGANGGNGYSSGGAGGAGYADFSVAGGGGSGMAGAGGGGAGYGGGSGGDGYMSGSGAGGGGYLNTAAVSNSSIVAGASANTNGSISVSWAPGGDACDGSPAVGTECNNGSFFIGSIFGVKIYAAAADEGTYAYGGYGVWLNGDSGGSQVPELQYDGLANTQWLVDDSPETHPAAQACADKTDGGRDDWYLPSVYELDMIWNQGSPIGGVLVDGTHYQTSTEDNEWRQHVQRFDNGNKIGATKNTATYRVRCVRRGSP